MHNEIIRKNFIKPHTAFYYYYAGQCLCEKGAFAYVPYALLYDKNTNELLITAKWI